mmetsp:Transcript_15963/g.55159  ORF Transcript_15963/g.55159 Transcript_15963/m.55159 type:complete len:336 (+) Transcript_15963:580-1587(+)
MRDASMQASLAPTARDSTLKDRDGLLVGDGNGETGRVNRRRSPPDLLALDPEERRRRQLHCHGPVLRVARGPKHLVTHQDPGPKEGSRGTGASQEDDVLVICADAADAREGREVCVRMQPLDRADERSIPPPRPPGRPLVDLLLIGRGGRTDPGLRVVSRVEIAAQDDDGALSLETSNDVAEVVPQQPPDVRLGPGAPPSHLGRHSLVQRLVVTVQKPLKLALLPGRILAAQARGIDGQHHEQRAGFPGENHAAEAPPVPRVANLLGDARHPVRAQDDRHAVLHRAGPGPVEEPRLGPPPRVDLSLHGLAAGPRPAKVLKREDSGAAAGRLGERR